MQFNDHPSVLPEIKAKGERDINAVNSYMDNIKGTVVSIQRIHSGQGGPYQDTVYESLIFCHQPNNGLTNAPLTRVINIDQAKAIAKIFVCDFEDVPANWASARLEYIRPEKNPCGLEEYPGHKSQGLHSCWRVRISLAYTG